MSSLDKPLTGAEVESRSLAAPLDLIAVIVVVSHLVFASLERTGTEAFIGM